MTALVAVLVSENRRRALAGATWIVTFAALVVAIGVIGHYHMRHALAEQARIVLRDHASLEANAAQTFVAMDVRLTAAPCSPAYMAQLKEIAFLPDGLHEFMHAPGGMVQCALTAGDVGGHGLGTPDIRETGGDGLTFFLDRNVTFLDLPKRQATIVLREPHAVILPARKALVLLPDWMAMETGLRTDAGAWVSRSGTQGLAQTRDESWLWPKVEACSASGVHCAIIRGDLVQAVLAAGHLIVLALVALALAASFIAMKERDWAERYASFEARFLRTLGPSTVVCVYQPILDLRTGRIAGCEVLARFIDVDGRIVYPDQFIPLIERAGLTRRFTQLVARHAHAALTDMSLPAGFQVNFNIWPQDLDADVLGDLFAHFQRDDHLLLALEITEDQSLPALAARDAVRRLQARGIKVYIDDFGAGYSNAENLALLDVDGVKLDRAFAMAPDESIMAKLMPHAIEMLSEIDAALVVEGVETACCLARLGALGGKVGHAQGYFISRPLSADRLAHFVASYSWTSPRPALASVQAA